MHAKTGRDLLCDCGSARTDLAAQHDARRCSVSLRTVSHTLEGHLAERLRYVAYRERVSESAVIEFALRGLLADGEDGQLGQRMRDGGATLRRKTR